MAHTWDHVHSSPQEICSPQLILPLEAKHSTIQATLNLMYQLSFPNIDTVENYLAYQIDQLIVEWIVVKENNAANEDC